jgi:hypothetical protein
MATIKEELLVLGMRQVAIKYGKLPSRDSVGGYDHSQIGKSLCCRSVCLSVGRSVGRSVVSRNQLVGKQSVRRKERMYSGRS